MPSTYSNSLHIELQEDGENVNTWGDILNECLTLLDAAIAGVAPIALTANYTLATSNGDSDEARNAVIITTGTGSFTVTVPGVSKVYLWQNNCTGNVTVTTGSGATATVLPAEQIFLMVDGTNVVRVFSQSMSGLRLQNVGAPTTSTDAATKGYVDNLVSTTAWELSAGQLPLQQASPGDFLYTNGNVASWEPITTSNVTDYVADQASRANAMTASYKAFAIAAAVAL